VRPTAQDGRRKRTTVESHVADMVLTFCENAAELGCPRDKDVDMWFRELPKGKMKEVAKKIIAIQKRNKGLRGNS
jgi:hypothetical protein